MDVKSLMEIYSHFEIEVEEDGSASLRICSHLQTGKWKKTHFSIQNMWGGRQSVNHCE